MTDLTEMIRKKASEKEDTAVIGFSDCIEVARQSGAKLKEVEIRCLEEDVVPARYERNIGTIGIEGQIRLLRSRVAVTGCGGLGGTVIEILARAGIGTLVLVDGDVFSDSNLNRQLLSEMSNLGKAKVEVAAERISRVNPAVETVVYNIFFDEKKGADILREATCVMDCLDNNHSRKLLYSVSSKLGIPVVHGAIGGFSCQTGVYFPGKTTHLDLFGEGISEKGTEVITGTPSFGPFVAGSIQACEAIKLISGVGEVLGGKLWILDLSQLFSDILSLEG
jgi:molybdopterin/thiamine biosynthesis adenylyltransferase